MPDPSASPLRVGPTLEARTFAEIRREMELSHFKWDAQVGDVTTLATFPLLIRASTWRDLAMWSERLTAETLAIEHELLSRPELHGTIALPRALRSVLASETPTPAAARVMRFDFHFTTDGWRVSEVNTDVPGGFTESTSLTRLVADAVPGAVPTGNPTAALIASIASVARDAGHVALMNAPGHLEDHQVIAYLANRLRMRGLATHVVSPGQLRWRDHVAHIETPAFAGRLGAIVRFYQAEWLADLPDGAGWQKLFAGGRTPVTNPGIASLSESKRLPLIWNELRTALPTWSQLLPETRALRDAPWSSDDGWVLKSAYSNTGDSVSIRAAMPRLEWQYRAWRARLAPSQWIAQRRFEVVPVEHGGEMFFPCIGVYTVNGVASGAYARIASGPVVDAYARDVALLISEEM